MVDMLRELVPDGRTHRLSVIVTGMLEYAVDKSMQIKHRNEKEHSVAMSLIDATDTSDPDSIKELIHDVVDRLFKDAESSTKGSASAANGTALLMKSTMNFRAGSIIHGIEVTTGRWMAGEGVVRAGLRVVRFRNVEIRRSLSAVVGKLKCSSPAKSKTKSQCLRGQK